MFKKFLMGLVCFTLVAMVGCGGGGCSSHTPTQDIKEAIKGKWYLQSRDDLNFYTSNNGNATYIEISFISSILYLKFWSYISQYICPAGHYIINLGCRRHPRDRTLSKSSSGRTILLSPRASLMPLDMKQRHLRALQFYIFQPVGNDVAHGY